MTSFARDIIAITAALFIAGCIVTAVVDHGRHLRGCSALVFGGCR